MLVRPEDGGELRPRSIKFGGSEIYQRKRDVVPGSGIAPDFADFDWEWDGQSAEQRLGWRYHQSQR